jgi:hypothetical protein
MAAAAWSVAGTFKAATAWSVAATITARPGGNDLLATITIPPGSAFPAVFR